MKKILIVVGVVFGVLLLGVGSAYGYVNGVRSDGVRKEAALAAQYKVNQNEQSTYTQKVYEMLDVANIKSAKMDSALTHAIQGRYGTDGFKAGGAFYAAVHEAYPTLDMALYDRIVDAVASGREAFKNQQNKLADMVRDYNTWRYDGLLRSMVVGNYFPSERLEVTVGDKRFTGKAALEKIDQMVLTQSTIDAFTTGRAEPLDLKNR